MITESVQSRTAHPPGSTASLAREQSWAALLLAWVAAFSDAIGYLVLQQLGASFMTGNSMAMGAALGRLDWPTVQQRGLPIVAFFLGNLLGSLVLRLVRRWGFHSPFAVVFSLEAGCLLAFLLLGNRALERGILHPSEWGISSIYVVLLTLAMGLQTATIRRAGGQSIRTTFVTGVLSDWADLLTQSLSWWRQQPTEQPIRQTFQKSMMQAPVRHLLLLAGIWGCYVLGAICGSALELRLALSALVFPVMVLVVLIVLDVLWPLQAPTASNSPG